jgi:hypothetical protein
MKAIGYRMQYGNNNGTGRTKRENKEMKERLSLSHLSLSLPSLMISLILMFLTHAQALSSSLPSSLSLSLPLIYRRIFSFSVH